MNINPLFCTLVTVVLLCQTHRASCNDVLNDISDTISYRNKNIVILNENETSFYTAEIILYPEINLVPNQTPYSHFFAPLSRTKHPYDFFDLGGPDISNFLVDLNINNKESNRCIKYERSDDTDIFTTVSPYLFDKIMDNEDIIWSPKNGKYPNTVFIGQEYDGLRDLEVFFPPKSKHPSKPQKHVQPESKPKSEVKFHESHFKPTTKPKLITLDIKLDHDTDSLIFKLDHTTGRIKYTCRPGFLINKIVSSNDLIDNCEHGDFYDRVVIFIDEDGDVKIRRFIPGERDLDDPEDVSSHVEPFQEPEKVQPTKPSEPAHKPKFISIDVKKNISTDEIDYHYDPLTKTHTFTPKHSHIINVVNRGSKNVYTYDSGHYPERVVVYFGENGKKLIRVDFPDDKPLSEPVKEISPRKVPILVRPQKPIEEPVLEVVPEPTPSYPTKSLVDTTFVVDGIVYNKIAIDLYIDFRKSISYNKNFKCVKQTIFRPNSNHLFKGVIAYRGLFGLSQSVLWQTEDPNECAFKVHLYGFDMIVVHSINGAITVVTKKNKYNWERRLLRTEAEKEDFNLQVLSEYTPESPKEIYTNKKSVSLNIDCKYQTMHWYYSKNNDVALFTPKEGFIFNVVYSRTGCLMCQDLNTIWSTVDSKNYSERIEYDYLNRLVTIYSIDGSISKFKNLSGFWVNYMFNHNIDNSDKRPIPLYMDRKSGYFECEFEKIFNGSRTTFVIKDGYAINEVMLLTSEYHLLRIDRRVWSTNNQLFYARKVIKRDYDLGEKYVTIELFNGLSMTFYRQTFGTKWYYLGSSLVDDKQYSAVEIS